MATEKFGWVLSTSQPLNPSTTNDFFAYQPDGLTDEEVIARETIQNTIDAGRRIPGVTELEFHKLEIKGEKKKQLMDRLKINEVFGKARMKAFGEDTESPKFYPNVSDFLNEEEELKAVLISDFNTTGLSGEFGQHENEDFFSKLVTSTNMGGKDGKDSTSGGSFGIGKTIFSRSSKIHTVIYHSTFKASKKSIHSKEEVSRRLLISGTYPAHKFKDSAPESKFKNYTGFGYYGVLNEADPTWVEPLVGEDAKELWGELVGLFNVKDPIRADEKYGTDILILMSDIDHDKVKKATEDYFFPAIVDKEIQIKFIDKQKKTTFPEPESRKDLDQFVTLWGRAKNKTKDEKENSLCKNIRKISRKKIGWYAFEVAEKDEKDSQYSNSVALVRNTGMVIRYDEVGDKLKEPPVVGVFIADDEICKILRASENASHSKWDAEANLLKKKFTEVDQQIVKKTTKQIRSDFRKFQRSLHSEDVDIHRESGGWAKKMSDAFSRSGNKPVPVGEDAQISRSLTKLERGMHRLKIESNKVTPDTPFDIEIKTTLGIVGDRKKVIIKHQRVLIKDEATDKTWEGSTSEDTTIKLKYKKGDVHKYLITFSDPGSREYEVKCDFELVSTLERGES